ncbi:sugar phosphate isomerase/epimerase [Geobacter sp. DSM 9736]|uniref:sugar phosphate isomerase/epimerase family protein n=1 Tax=Geobacter sp. DSM 9736 TaxID=1277350 RepID=UPI000B4FDC6E|nr:sugar phosphate isomerase/epimerase [Geobacter sp. DSM 9736]SNB48002.1 Sugar phosphate isomerase/epimerase [Geobacter sp. DSM 9736]
MRFSLSTGTLFTFPLKKACAIAAEAGFDGVELIINDEFQKVSCRQLIEEVCSILPVLSIHAPFMPLDGWGSPADSLKRCVELAGICNVPLVNFHPPSWMGLEIRFMRWFYRIFDFQKEVGQGQVAVTVENMPWTGRFKINQYVLSQTEKMIEFLGERNLFLTFDCTHMGTGKTNFINDFYLFYNSGRIRNIHFSDFGYGREHLLPGRGVLPLTRFLNHLRNTGYDETLTLELSPHEFPNDELIIVETLRDILYYLRQETDRTGLDSAPVQAQSSYPLTM